MKPIRIAQTPTRNRPLNMLLGVVLMLAAALLLLSLATYHPADPSFNTSTGVTGPHTVRNWIGPTGAYLSDLLLQVFGVAAFGLPLWLGGLGWTWFRSKYNGAAWLRWTGVILTLAFLPAVAGLLPWHWHWLHAMPIEGITGRLISDQLTGYLNLTGAWIVAAVLAAGGLYLGSNFSLRTAWEWSQERSIQLSALHDRWRNWQADRADRRAEKEAIREAERGPMDAHAAEEMDEIDELPEPGFFARIFGFLRRRKPSEEDLLDEVPAFERMKNRPAEEIAPRHGYAPSIWERHEAAPPGYAPARRAPEDEIDIVPISSRGTNPANVIASSHGEVVHMPLRMAMPKKRQKRPSAKQPQLQLQNIHR